MRSTEQRQVEHNIRVHDRIARTYEERHGEIYNEIEQERLHRMLECACGNIRTDSEPKTALDLGCGSGNLTDHLIQLGLHTVAADVSDRFLRRVWQQFSPTNKLEVLKLNGNDLSNIEDASFDLVATYSVLHHVPDYLGIVSEMVRVLKPGGVIYIDHEVNENYWKQDSEYTAFRQSVRRARRAQDGWTRHFHMPRYREELGKLFKLVYPRWYSTQGDIHVWPDDHVKWASVEQCISSRDCEIILEHNYLLYRRGCPIELYRRYEDRFSDMCVLIGRKK